MTGTVRWPRFSIACSEGNIFLYARSPVAPKKTSASEWDGFIGNSLLRGLLEVSTEPETHGRQQFVLVIGLSAGGEALVQGCGENRHGHRLVDGGLDRPATFSGVGYTARELLQLGILHQRRGRQVEQPRCHDATAPPYLGDITQVEVV